MSESAGRTNDMRLLNISQQLYDDLVRDATLWRTRLASHAEREDARWCSYCGVDTHNDAECWSTRPADWSKERYPDAFKFPPAPSPAGPDALAEPIDGVTKGLLDRMRDWAHVHPGTEISKLLGEAIAELSAVDRSLAIQAAALRSRPAQGDSRDAERLRYLIAHAFRKQPAGFGSTGREPYYWHLPILPEAMTVRAAIDAAMSQQEGKNG